MKRRFVFARVLWRILTAMLTISALTLRLALYALRARVEPRMADVLERRAARRLARTLERLGATYVKLGQLLAMRGDFLSAVYVEELAFLLDQVQPFPTAVARRTIEHDLGRTIGDLFESFDEQPIASASFGQVYDARLKGGDRVVVKIRRPDVEIIVRADLAAIAVLAWLIDLSTLMLTVSMRDFYREFQEYTNEELDYTLEARNIERLYRNAVDSEIERIPAVYWDLTRPRVLVLEHLQGIWVNDILAAWNAGDEETLAEWRAQGLDLGIVARRLLYVLLRQGFACGAFHADPHAANIVILRGNVIGLVDFGIVGRIGSDYQRYMFQLMRSMGEGNANGAFAAIVKVLTPGAHVNLREFKRRYEANVHAWFFTVTDAHAPVRTKTAARLILKNLALFRRFGLRLPAGVARFYRALLIVDSVVIQLCPEVDMAAELSMSMRQIAVDRLAGRLDPGRVLPAVLGYAGLLLDIPGAVSNWLESGLLTDSLESISSLDMGAQGAGRFMALSVAALLRAAGLVAMAGAVLLLMKPLPSVRPRDLFVGGVMAMFASRAIRARIV